MSSSGLDQLRDIHMPAHVSMWPFAWGWYVLGSFVILFSVLLVVWMVKAIKRYWFKRMVLKELYGIEMAYQHSRQGGKAASSISILLKRVAIARFPARNIAALYGAKWLDFLGEVSQLDFYQDDVKQLLEQGLYQKETRAEAVWQLCALCRQWINQVL